MHHRLISLLAASWIASHGCADVASTESVPTKHDVVAGKADGIGWCSSLGADPGCDVCAEMGWYGDGSCDATLVGLGVCHEPDPDCNSAFCFYQHVADAIELNEHRKPLYASLTDGESLAASNALLNRERLARPIAVIFDMRARRWQDAGIDIVCDEFVSMDLAPEFQAQSDAPPTPPEAYEKVKGLGLSWRLTRASATDGYEGLTAAVEQELDALAAAPSYHCMVRHLLESILLAAHLAPMHAEQAANAGLPSPAALSRDLIAAQIAALPAAAGIDDDAFPVQAQGVPIICQDVPPIWPPR